MCLVMGGSFAGAPPTSTSPGPAPSSPATSHQRFVFCSSSVGYRSPMIGTSDATLSISARSALVSSTAAAPRFSCSRRAFVVPGIGTIHGAWARTQASASWAGVAVVAAVEGGVLVNGAGEEAAPQRAVGHEPDAQFRAHREHFALRLPPP